MSALPWSKFFWADWDSDESLRLCSPGAQALWMRMLCICAKGGGYLTIADQPLGPLELAQMTGWPINEVEMWFSELARWGVYSIDRKGRVFCRRIIRDAKKSKIARENGKNGGNPSLGKVRRIPTSDNPPLKGEDKTQKPEARSQKVEDANASLSSADDAPVPSKYPEPFETAWKAYPHVKGRSSKSKAFAAWRRLPVEIRAGLPPAIARYAREGREPKAECGAPAMDRWLRDGRYEDWITSDRFRPAPKPEPAVYAAHVRHYRDTGEWKPTWGDKPDLESAA